MTKHREVLAQVALVALLAVTILLVVVALRPPTSPATAAGPRPSASGASAATTMSSGNPTSTTSSSTRTTSQPGKGSAGDLRLTLGPSGRIYRWTPGSCAAGGASLKISTDNAKTWTDRSDGLHALLDVDPAADRLTLVTADKSCRTGSRVSTDDGENWTTRTVSAYLWLPATDDRSAVRLGSNASVSVCPDGEVSGVRDWPRRRPWSGVRTARSG